MAKWKCEICGDEFDNFHAQGFDNKIYLVIYIKSKKKQIIKYFETEYEKDKYKRRLPFIPDFILIEDSSDINWNYS